jgi:hypothetical protein
MALDLALALLVFALALEVAITLERSEGLLHASADLVGVLAQFGLLRPSVSSSIPTVWVGVLPDQRYARHAPEHICNSP